MHFEPVHTPIGTPTALEPLLHNAANEATGGIWRATGPAGTAVLKHATPGDGATGPWASGTDAHHWNYWKREYLAYTTGQTERYGAGTALRAPRLLAAGERPDGSVELWLEDLPGPFADQWTVEQFAHFARQLGTAQARHATTDPQPWHSRSWLRHYAGRHTPAAVPWDHPAASRHWPEDLRTGLRTLWEHRTDLFDRAASFPQTLCHLDVWPMNLTRSGTDPVLIDWAFIGRGAIGEDIANLIADTFLDGLQPVDRLDEVKDALIDAYLAGLAEAGRRTGPVPAAIAATGAAKYCWLAPLMLTRLARGEPLDEGTYEAAAGAGDDAVLARSRPVLAMLVDWARTALDH
ncbi:MAG TPA: hypothetical protein VFU12_04545 [Glycomyces sp.]|nr:hypothetical protein [Glycomyces sp.]